MLSSIYNNLGNVYLHQRRLPAAEFAYEKALEIRKDAVPPDELGISLCLDNLGRVQMLIGHPQQAAALFEEAYEIRVKVFPTRKHPKIAKTLSYWGWALAGMGQCELAKQKFSQAMEIDSSMLPPDSADTIEIRNALQQAETNCSAANAPVLR